jgi:tRNA (guanine-N7-)-methyltransferase
VVKKKLAHFAENLTFSHLFQNPYPDFNTVFVNKNLWRSQFFKNENPLILELGCGKGEYTFNLGVNNPGRNFIGVDIKGARLWKGCRLVHEYGLTNVAFIRTRIEYIEYFFGKDEIDEIWLTFPDPQPQSNRKRKRLTSPLFLNRYKNILKKDGIIHLKTDNSGLYDFTLEIIEEQGHHLVFKSEDIYRMDQPHEATAIQTFYEAIYEKEGIPIKYIEFTLNHESRQ